jgi:hypothetical protein
VQRRAAVSREAYVRCGIGADLGLGGPNDGAIASREFGHGAQVRGQRVPERGVIIRIAL